MGSLKYPGGNLPRWRRQETENRTENGAETGAKTIATACPFCMTMIENSINQTGRQDEMQVKDVAELVLESLA